MTLEELCVSLDEAKGLKMAGFPQGKSYAVWYFYDCPASTISPWIRARDIIAYPMGNPPSWCAAPTLAEILEELPEVVYEHEDDDNSDHYLYMAQTKDFKLNYESDWETDKTLFDKDLSPADLYIRLAKEGLITRKDKP